MSNQTRAPQISGTNVVGEWIEVDYSRNLISAVLFFEPVSGNSSEAVELVQRIARRYEKLPVGFWFIMEPRLSCMFRGNTAQLTLQRFNLMKNSIFDGNGMMEHQARIKAVPALFVVDSNSFLKLQCEGEISFREFERTIQARLAASGYREDLPAIGELDYDFPHPVSYTMKQMGYVTGDYLFSSLVTPETDQQFSLPDFYLPNTIYPCGSWFVGRDFIEGKSGSTVYISCLKDESVNVFFGSEEGASVRVHTSMESTHHLVLGKDITKNRSILELKVNEFRPYEILSLTGDSDVLISLQVSAGSLKLYCVEYRHCNQVTKAVF
ncbi:MAG TPA: hypothetical protein VLX91_00545 [Candidatus Acidoferrales bacterium]|nr:hypothetical protein [Candidatus Acidoferrales bacterium]